MPPEIYPFDTRTFITKIFREGGEAASPPHRLTAVQGSPFLHGGYPLLNSIIIMYEKIDIVR
jgi:hypothetical protein